MVNTLTTLGKKILVGISRNSPVILTVMAVTGVVSTTIFAIGATPKAMTILDDKLYSDYVHERERTAQLNNVTFTEWLLIGTQKSVCSWNDKISKFTPLEIAELVWKCYIPTVISASITIGSMIGVNSIHTRRNAAIASLYSLTETALKEYQGKVIETIGKNKELKIRDDISADHISSNPVSPAQVILTGKGDSLFYDTVSGRYFKTDIEKLRRISHQINNDLVNEHFISLNNFYNELGLTSIALGDDIGWTLGGGALIIQFSAHLTEDEVACIALNYDVRPKYL